MLEKKTQSNTPIEVQEIHNTINILSSEVSHLEDKKKELDILISNREKFLEEYKDNQIILNETIEHINGKKVLLDKLNGEVDVLVEKIAKLTNESNILEISVKNRKNLISDIDTLKKNIDILQKEMGDFQDQSIKNKKNAQIEFDNIKHKIQELKSHIDGVISNI